MREFDLDRDWVDVYERISSDWWDALSDCYETIDESRLCNAWWIMIVVIISVSGIYVIVIGSVSGVF